eukprot:UN10551
MDARVSLVTTSWFSIRKERIRCDPGRQVQTRRHSHRFEGILQPGRIRRIRLLSCVRMSNHIYLGYNAPRRDSNRRRNILVHR